MSTASTVPTIDLGDGVMIPQLGFGVFQIDSSETSTAVQQALEVGYRHIDTAEMYKNEAGVGEGLRASGIDRSEVFITSKLNNGFHEPDDARRAFDATLTALGSDYVDLFLIHWPLPTLYGGDFVKTWKALESMKADGRAKAIGVSNFQVAHLERLGPLLAGVQPEAIVSRSRSQGSEAWHCSQVDSRRLRFRKQLLARITKPRASRNRAVPDRSCDNGPEPCWDPAR